MKKTIATLCIILLLAGCITTTAPDGSTTQRMDYELASFALESAVTLYNLYRTADTPPEQSKLTELLDNVERIEAIYNRLRDDFGKADVTIVKNANGTLELKQ
jgi:PBP1b-binding outer membrane lipoprotein LpoB